MTKKVAKALRPVLEAVEEASGLKAEVVYQHPQSGEFRFALLDDGEVVGEVTVARGERVIRPRKFDGAGVLVTGPEMDYHVDTSRTDNRWAHKVLAAIMNEPDPGPVLEELRNAVQFLLDSRREWDDNYTVSVEGDKIVIARV